MNKEILKKGGAVLGLLVLLMSFTSAFAVSSEYWEDNALTIYPGEAQDFSIVLQNLAGTPADIDVVVEITQGGDYVTFENGVNEFSVPFGTKVTVPLTISISKYTEIGKKFPLVISVKTKSTGEAGEFKFGSSIEREIPVRVVSEPMPEVEEFNWMWVAVSMGVVILTLLIFGFFYMRKK